MDKKRASSRSSYFENLEKARVVMKRMTILEKVDVTVKLLVSHDLNEEKLSLRIS